MRNLWRMLAILGVGALLVAEEKTVPGFRDDFRGEVRPEWTIRNENPDNIDFNKQDECLTITTEFGSIWNNSQNDAKNVFLIEPPEHLVDYVMTTRLVKFSPDARYQQAGLICFEDEDNYLKFVMEFDPGNGGLTLTVLPEVEGRAEANHTLKVDQKIDSLWLRVIKTGGIYLCAASRDGKTYRTVAVLNWKDDNPTKHVGLLAKNGGSKNSPGTDAHFDFFEIVPLNSLPELLPWIKAQTEF